jgi:hypothetical protein
MTAKRSAAMSALGLIARRTQPTPAGCVYACLLLADKESVRAYQKGTTNLR